MVTGVGAERATRVVGVVGAFHGKALGNLRAALQVGDEAALSSKADLDAGSVVRAIEFLSGVLL